MKLNPDNIEANVEYTENLPKLDIGYIAQSPDNDPLEVSNKQQIDGMFSFTYPRWNLNCEYKWPIGTIEARKESGIKIAAPEGEYYIMRTTKPDMYIIPEKIATKSNRKEAEGRITIKDNKIIKFVSFEDIFEQSILKERLAFERIRPDLSKTGTSY